MCFNETIYLQLPAKKQLNESCSPDRSQCASGLYCEPLSANSSAGSCKGSREYYAIVNIILSLSNKHNKLFILYIYIYIHVISMFYYVSSCHLENAYEFFGGCERGNHPCPRSEGLTCGDDHSINYIANKTCTICSFEQCMQHALANNSYAFSYRNVRLERCRLCDEDGFASRKKIYADQYNRDTWGLYIRSIRGKGTLIVHHVIYTN